MLVVVPGKIGFVALKRIAGGQTRQVGCPSDVGQCPKDWLFVATAYRCGRPDSYCPSDVGRSARKDWLLHCLSLWSKPDRVAAR
jgi:hypothetical protein